MKKIITAIAVMFFCLASGRAQQFISEGVIEYEVKTNLQKTIGSGVWADLMKQGLPTFSTSYYTLTFSGNKSMYKFDHWMDGLKLPDFMKGPEEGQSWYNNYDTDSMNMVKEIGGTKFVINDVIRKKDWKLENEYRIIAGFNCKKAVAIVFDSVYVFAFYTEEILLPGGPFSINGLPGTVLGVTIPRMYTSWIATKVTVKDIKAGAIQPVSGKNVYTRASLNNFFHDRLKDWYDADNPEQVKERDRMLWGFFL